MKVVLTLAFVFLVMTVARAKTAKELSDICTSGSEKKQADTSLLCFGYIEGAAEEITSRATVFEDELFLLTFKEPYTIEQLRDSFLEFVKEHPAQERNPAIDVLIHAWMMRHMLKSTFRSCEAAPDPG